MFEGFLQLRFVIPGSGQELFARKLKRERLDECASHIFRERGHSCPMPLGFDPNGA